MTTKKAKEQGYTHYAIMYGIHGYCKILEDDGLRFQTRWLITDYIHEAICYLDSVIGFSPYGFPVKVGDKLI